MTIEPVKTSTVTLSEDPSSITLTIREGGVTVAAHKMPWQSGLALMSSLSGAISTAAIREGRSDG